MQVDTERFADLFNGNA